MSRPVLLSLLVYLLILGSLASLNGAVLALALPVLLYVLYGFWTAPQELKLEVQRAISADRVAPDSPVVVTVTVRNRGGPLDRLILEDGLAPRLTLLDGSNRHFTSLAREATFTFSYTLKAPRGRYDLEELRAEASDPLRLLPIRETVRVSSQMLVFPRLARLPYVAIRPRRTRVYAGAIPARTGGSGVEFFGVRDYSAGDPPGHINWRASARQLDALYSNEFQQERVADAVIVLDGREKVNLFPGGHSLFEHSVLAAGALAAGLLAQGNRVGMLVYGAFLHWTLPGYGKIQRERILQSLARAQPGSSAVFEGLEYLPWRALPPESQVVLVSPLQEKDYETLIQLRARGYQVLVVSPDPIAFEQGFLADDPEIQLAARIVRLERAQLLRRLQRAGIRCLEWNVAQPFDQSVGRIVRRGTPLAGHP